MCNSVDVYKNKILLCNLRKIIHIKIKTYSVRTNISFLHNVSFYTKVYELLDTLKNTS